MSVLEFFRLLFIQPLELIFDVIYTFAYRVIGDPGFAIFALSLAINLLVLPLYKRADAVQDEQRKVEQKLSKWVNHIKKTFKGDERFMMLQEYYRQNNYKPASALNGSISLLLEIPFFMAAYHFLSNLELIQGIRFGIFRDLGQPDSLFRIGDFPINVLPILMTVINIISGIIYTKGLPRKNKIQLYAMAAVFLVLLYDSPSGLVIYWTLNNIFSLGKNIYYKVDNHKIAIMLQGLLAAFCIAIGLLFNRGLVTDGIILVIIGILIIVKMVIGMRRKKEADVTQNVRHTRVVFIMGCVFNILLLGCLIPSAVIESSTLEFINPVLYLSPNVYVLRSLFIAAGLFGVWMNVFYYLASERGKQLFSLGMWLISIIGIIDYMFFGKNLGTISTLLQYEIEPVFSTQQILINIAVIVAAAGVCLFIYKKPAVTRIVLVTLIMAIGIMAGKNMIGIQMEFLDSTYMKHQNTAEDIKLSLSREGKNVVVIMLDRGMGTHIPFIMKEKPELLQQFDGFTYYPNTISYGPFSNIAMPALWGGYDYTPEELNKRDDMLLSDKHDEALRVMPEIFSDNGYEITVCDPTYAGYKEYPDLSIYDDHPEYNLYITRGKFNETNKEFFAYTDSTRDCNFLCYGIVKTSPLFLQPILYNGGGYNQANSYSESTRLLTLQFITGLSKSSGYKSSFMDNYTTLENFPNITEITDSSRNSFIMLTNDTTHEEALLQKPDYVPAMYVDNTPYDMDINRYAIDGRVMHMLNEYQVTHYHVNMAAMIQIGKWLDYLKEQGVYDNTRIIICSDHGRNLEQFDDMMLNPDMDIEFVNPLLMVKDFNATGFKTDDQFMTNADVPTLATENIINNPVNPFTGNPIDSSRKAGEQHILYSGVFNVAVNNGYTFVPDQWYSVKDNIFDFDNWEYLGEH